MSISAYYPYTPIPVRFSYLRNKVKVNPLVINYHTVSNKELPHIINLYRYRDVNGFRQDLDFFISRYRPISMLELLESLKHKKSKLPENAVLLTFDDGFREIYDIVAPLLLEKKFPATFFIISKCIDNKCLSYNNKKSLVIEYLKKNESLTIVNDIDDIIRKNNIPGKNLPDSIRNIPYITRHLIDLIASLAQIDFSQFLEESKPYLSTNQIEDLLQSGFAFGGHSLDHARFTELSLEEQIQQARLSIDYLVEQFSIGLMKDPQENHFQRISIEKFNQSAKRTIKFHYTRKIIYHFLGLEYIIRN